jgi:hypothetical protein
VCGCLPSTSSIGDGDGNIDNDAANGTSNADRGCNSSGNGNCNSNGNGMSDKKAKGPTSAQYKIPYGDWFELVSAPHYFAEILIYLAIGLVGSRNPSGWLWVLVVVFVTVTLTFAGVETHTWYRKKFDDYPPQRHAVFPWLF